jgi:hypothetical protein
MRIVAELEKDIYLLQLTCGWGRGASIYSWFIYHPETGIQADVFKLSIASLNKSGKFTVREETSLFLRDFVYDAVKKEVTVSVPCHQADGHVASRTTYIAITGLVRYDIDREHSFSLEPIDAALFIGLTPENC